MRAAEGPRSHRQRKSAVQGWTVARKIPRAPHLQREAPQVKARRRQQAVKVLLSLRAERNIQSSPVRSKVINSTSKLNNRQTNPIKPMEKTRMMSHLYSQRNLQRESKVGLLPNLKRKMPLWVSLSRTKIHSSKLSSLSSSCHRLPLRVPLSSLRRVNK